jgi:hypothetical protein
MNDESEINWHRGQIAKNRELIEELEAGNTTGGDVLLETQAEIDRLKVRIEQSERIVAAYNKEHPQGSDPSTVPGQNEPTVHDRALAILREFEQAQNALMGRAVVLSDGKAGSVEKVQLDELHGLRVTVIGHEGDWPISTMRLSNEV